MAITKNFARHILSYSVNKKKIVSQHTTVFPNKNPVCILPVLHTCHMPHPSYFLNLVTLVIFDEEYNKVLQYAVLPGKPTASFHTLTHFVINHSLNICLSKE
jgi:hypothetical protein